MNLTRDSLSLKVQKCCCRLQDEEIKKIDIVELGLNEVDAWKCYKIDGYKGAIRLTDIFSLSLGLGSL